MKLLAHDGSWKLDSKDKADCFADVFARKFDAKMQEKLEEESALKTKHEADKKGLN